MMNKVLLMAGIAAVVVYVIGDLLSSLLSNGYSYIDQWISELSAFGSPVRPLMVTVILIHDVLLVAFGVGVLRVSRRKSLSWVGGLLIAIGVSGLPTHTVWAMSSPQHGVGVQRHDARHLVGGLWRPPDCGDRALRRRVPGVVPRLLARHDCRRDWVRNGILFRDSGHRAGRHAVGGRLRAD